MTSTTVHGAGRHADCRDHRARIGQPFAGNVKRCAVIGRRAHEWQAKRCVHAVIKMQRLERDQRLIMIHADDTIEAPARLGVK